MKTMPLGKTGVDVSALCLGTMYFGTRNDKATSHQMLELYLEAGGTFLDTANIYSHWVNDWAQGGESETLLGEWMKERGNRDQLFIASKVGFGYPAGSDVGLKAHQIETECEVSLKRLQTDHIDLYYAHHEDPSTPPEETMEAFDRLVKAGKVRYIGASNYLSWRLEEAHWVSENHGWADFCCLQQRYSYLRPGPRNILGPHVLATEDILAYARYRGITILAFSAMLDGAFTRSDREFPPEYLGPDSDDRLKVLNEVAGEVGATSSQVVLAWMLHSDPAVLPLISASSPKTMQDNLGALNVSLDADQMQRLNNAGA